MRKLSAALFALLLVAALAGCSSDDSDDEAVDGNGTAQTESNGSGSSDDGSDAEGSGDTDGSEDEGSQGGDEGGPAGGGDPVTVPDDLVSDVKDLAADEEEDVTDEEAACIAEMMVMVLGEDGAREAIDGGVDRIEAALGEATDDFSDEASAAMLGNLSEECQMIMLGGADLDAEGVGAPAGGLED